MILNKNLILFTLIFLGINFCEAEILQQNTSSISPKSLQNFDNNPVEVKKIVLTGLNLANKKLGYLYGSANPVNKAMDCSGTIQYILSSSGLKNVPRSSELLYQWALKYGKFYRVQGDLDSPDFANLKPGNLLFWSGTYETTKITNASHTMIYLGKNSKGKHLMMGSSNGRTYEGNKVYGVSVFDFILPKKDSKSNFLGYSCIPKFTC